MELTAPSQHRTLPPRPVGPCQWAFPHPDQILQINGQSVVATADDETGFIAYGADLTPATLVHAYSNGIFPWPSGKRRGDARLPWCSPNPRGVLGLDRLRISRSLRQTMQRSGWSTTMNRDFANVMKYCAVRPGEGTWITKDMQAAYLELHRQGYAHSVEVWDNDVLVGGLYGVLSGGVFTGESMFHRATDASKVAFADLTVRMIEAKGAFIDVQLPTNHLASLGVIAIHRSLFLEILTECRTDQIALCTDQLSVSRIPNEYKLSVTERQA